MIIIDKALSHKLSNMGFLCMCLVVALHVHVDFSLSTWKGLVHTTICGIASVAVPMFFAISGFLLVGHFAERGWWMREVRKRIKSLLVPYVVWNLFSLFFSYALMSASRRVGVNFGDGQYEIVNLNRILLALGVNPNRLPELNFLWFVRSLFCFVLVGPCFLFVRKRVLGAIVLFALFSAYVMMPCMLPPAADWQAHFLKYAWMKGILFFSVGAYLRWYGDKVSGVFGRRPGWLCLAVGVVLLIFSSRSGIDVERTVAIPLLMIGIWKILPCCEWPKWLTSSAFPIFLLHHFVLIALIAAYRVCGIKDAMRMYLWTYLLQVPVVITICIGITLSLRKCCPIVARIVFGGR